MANTPFNHHFPPFPPLAERKPQTTKIIMAAKKKAAKKVTKKAVKKAAPKKKAAKKAAPKKAAKKPAKRGAKKVADLIISKSRTKNAVAKCNVSGDFYGALDAFVRDAIKAAENRATENGRKTLRPQDL
jgi:hypothetical protein